MAPEVNTKAQADQPTANKCYRTLTIYQRLNTVKMRTISMMWSIVLIILCSITISATVTETDTSTDAARNWPVVFGFEFTMDGIVTSAGLPNGSTVPIGSTQGSAAYRTEMARLYSICEETARTGNLPDVAQEYLSAGAVQRKHPMRWMGEPVDALSEAVTAAKRVAFDTLVVEHRVTDLDFDTTLHALAVPPNFIFTALKPVKVTYPLPLWELRAHERETYPDMSEQLVAKAWMKIMATQFSEVSTCSHDR